MPAPCQAGLGVAPGVRGTRGRVVALRCTPRLLRRLDADVVLTVAPAGNALGHWYANVVTLNRKPHVLALSERSLLSILLPAAPFATLLKRFPVALEELLRALFVPANQISRELEATTPLVAAKTASRKPQAARVPQPVCLRAGSGRLR